VSYLEIYNESVNDLLDLKGTNLKIREDQTSSIGAYVEGLSVRKLKNFQHFLKILDKGEKNRQYAKTEANEQYTGAYSSRSHTIIRIVSYSVEELAN
jgi:centromeric protein E